MKKTTSRILVSLAIVALGVLLLLMIRSVLHDDVPGRENLPCATSWPSATFIGADSGQLGRREGVVSQFSKDGTFLLTICLGYGAPTACPYWCGVWTWSGNAIVANLSGYEERFREKPPAGPAYISKRVLDPPIVVTYTRLGSGGQWISKSTSSELDWAEGLKWTCDEKR